MFASAFGRRFCSCRCRSCSRAACLSPPWLQRFFGITTQALEYFHDAVRHDTTQASRDLGLLGIECPRLADYLPHLISFYRAHKDDVRPARHD
jgi:hypothetical protein